MGKKRSPRGRTGVIFDAMRFFGFHPTDIEFGDGYFIFDHGKDMVVHFHVKELKGWKFGIWWNLDGEEQFDFFGQFERDIDKFKPAASVFKAEDVTYYDEEDVHKWTHAYDDFINILKFIKRYPHVAWEINSRGYGDKLWDIAPYSELRCWWGYKKHLHRLNSYERAYKRLSKKYLKLLGSISYICFVNAEIVDRNTDGWICTPRWKILCDDVTWTWEKSEPGRHILYLNEQLSDYMLGRVKRYKAQYERFVKKRGKYGWGKYGRTEDLRLEDELEFIIRKKRGKKGEKDE